MKLATNVMHPITLLVDELVWFEYGNEPKQIKEGLK